MRTATTIAQVIVRIAGLLQIILGVLFWTGNLRTLTGLHIQIGFLLVIALLVLAGLGMRAGVPLALIGAAVLWVVITPALGMVQSRLLPGSFHWIIQLLHLIVGLGAMGFAERIAQHIKGEQPRVVEQPAS